MKSADMHLLDVTSSPPLPKCKFIKTNETRCCLSWMLIRFPTCTCHTCSQSLHQRVRKGPCQLETEALGPPWTWSWIDMNWHLICTQLHAVRFMLKCTDRLSSPSFCNIPTPCQAICPVCWKGPYKHLFSKTHLDAQKSPALTVWSPDREEGSW